MHIGWKFTSPTDHFYGLIVDYKSDDEAEVSDPETPNPKLP